MINGSFQLENFSKVVALKRAEAMLTLRQLEELTGIHRSILSRIETNVYKKALSWDQVITLCNWLELPVQHFVTPIKKDDNKKSSKGRTKKG
jgi:transcriptional regulator with XRE-family HTH domain